MTRSMIRVRLKADTTTRALLPGIFLALLIGQTLTRGVHAQQTQNAGTWTTYSGSDSGQRHSPLTQITPANVGRLAVQWMFQTGVPGRLETTPLVVDGIMYVSAPWSVVQAIDARTGKKIWTFDPEVARDKGFRGCCDVVNRGVALHKGNVYWEMSGWAPKYFPASLKVDMRARLQDKIMFGSDYPSMPYARILREWQELGYSDAVMEKIFHQNAERILGL